MLYLIKHVFVVVVFDTVEVKSEDSAEEDNAVRVNLSEKAAAHPTKSDEQSHCDSGDVGGRSPALAPHNGPPVVFIEVYSLIFFDHLTLHRPMQPKKM